MACVAGRLLRADDGRMPAPEHVLGSAETSNDVPAVLTVDELATLLRLDRKTVYAMVRRAEIPGVRRFGRAVRVHRDTVLRWLADGQGQAPRPRRRP